MRYSIISISVAIILAACAPAPTPTPTPAPTAPPNAQATATAQAQATVTAQAAATATTQAQSAATAQANANATAAAQAQATAVVQTIQQTVNALIQNSKKAFGPTDGTLEIVKDFRVPVVSTNLNLRNFVAEAQYFNPADPAIHPWDYGIQFREIGRVVYIAIVQGNAAWQVVLTTGRNLPDGRAEVKEIGSGTLTNLDVSPNGSNQLRFVVQDKVGYFFVNGNYVATLDLSENNADGNILISSGNRLVNEFPGMSTRFKNFVISSLP